MRIFLQATFLVLLSGLFARADSVNYRYDQAGRLAAVEYGNGSRIDYTYDAAGNLLRREVTSVGGFTTVSSASFAAGKAVAPESIAAGFGQGLATGKAFASETPLPTELLGTRVEVTDSQGTMRLAPLFFVSAGQINYLVPAGTAPGQAVVRTVSGAGGQIPGTLLIDRVAPGLYAANQQGSGVAAGFFLRLNPDGSRTQDLLFDPSTAAAIPVSVDASKGEVILILFGTGFRGFQSQVTATVNGVSVPVQAAVPQPQFVGLDQINIGPLPSSLANSGEVNIVLTADGKDANTVTVAIQ